MGVSGKRLAAAGCKYLGWTYQQIDCQAFVEKTLSECGVRKDLAGSNAWYRMMDWTGTPEECRKKFGKIPDGAFLFILENDGKEPAKYRNDGVGNASHIGIYTGMTGKEMVAIAEANGNESAAGYNYGSGAIHSSASKGHVCTSNFAGKTIKGGWNRIGLWSQIDYGADLGIPCETPAESEVSAEETIIGNGIVYAGRGSTVKMRQRPSTGCDVYWDVPIGEMVQILKEGDWDRILWNGRVGYMKREFILPDGSQTGAETALAEPVPSNEGIQIATVTADRGKSVKMRARPSSSCRTYDNVPIGATVAVLEAGGIWSKIRYGIRNGWYMMTAYLRFENEGGN